MKDEQRCKKKDGRQAVYFMTSSLNILRKNTKIGAATNYTTNHRPCFHLRANGIDHSRKYHNIP